MIEVREVAGPIEEDALGLEPVVHERGLELRHDRTFDPEVRVAPVIFVLGVAQPLVRHTGTAGEPHQSIHDQQLPMGAMIEVVELVPVEWSIEHDLDAGLPEPRDIITVDLVGAGPVDDDVRAHAGPGPIGERRGELAADRRRPVDVALEGDGTTCRADGREHRGKDLVAVIERRDLVARHEAGAEQAPHGAHEL